MGEKIPEVWDRWWQPRGKEESRPLRQREGRRTQSQPRPDWGFLSRVDILSLVYLNLDVNN